MADVTYGTAPRLTQTTAKENVYAPVSWLAVAAGIVTLVFIIILVVMGLTSLLTKRHLLAQELLIFPAFGLALAFAAYHHVKNSEGTRSGILFGLNLVTFAAGASLLGGAGFIAYLTAVEFSIRQDAENEFMAWANNFKNLNSNDDSGKELAPIVHKTIPPSAQQSLSATDTAALMSSFSEQFVQVANSDLTRIAMRNPGKIEFKPLGLVNWVREKDRIQCEMNAEMQSPEGIHSLSFKMFAEITTKNQRVWMIENKQTYHTTRLLTDYGVKAEEIEFRGYTFSRRFLSIIDISGKIPDAENRDVLRYSAYTDYMKQPYVLSNNNLTLNPQFLRQSVSLFGGSATASLVVPDYVPTIVKDYFFPIFPSAGMAPDDRTKKEKEYRDQFTQVWNQSRIVSAGVKINQTKDVAPVLTFDEKAIRVTIPVEMATSLSDTVRGRLVCVCVDPKLVSELNQLKAMANPANARLSGVTAITAPTEPWRVVQIRSDMRPVVQKSPQQAQAITGE